MGDVDYQEGFEPQARIIGASHGCMYGYSMLLYAAMAGLAIGSVIMLVLLFVPWLIPVAMVAYLVWQSRRAVTGYSRGRAKR